MHAADTTIANRVMDATQNFLIYLADRWRDESQYEDFSEYGEAMKSKLAAVPDATFIAMTKRPFGFKWRGNDGYERHTTITRDRIRTVRIGIN